MQLDKIYKQNKLALSFEVFPPKSAEGIDKLIRELALLKKFDPAYISVTYGAGGSTQGRSLEVIKKIIYELELKVMPHLTCIGSSPESILEFIHKIESWGIENILALRGDYPQHDPDYQPESDFFQHASDLVKFTNEKTGFDVAVAGFPEVHPEAKSREQDLEFLKRKVDQGAKAIITQLFFHNEDYFRFIEAARKRGITVPIIPGIWTLTSQAQVERIPTLCDARLPQRLVEIMADKNIRDEDKQKHGVEYAVQQIKELQKHNIPGVHLYTLNKAKFVAEVLQNI